MMKGLFCLLGCLMALVVFSCSTEEGVLTPESGSERDIQGIIGNFKSLGGSDSLVDGLAAVLRDPTVSGEEKAVAICEAFKGVQLEKLQELMSSESPRADSAEALYRRLTR